MSNEEFLNNSGEGPNASIPAEIAKKFNWGAFLLNWIWGLGNRSYLTLVIFAASIFGFIPLIGALVPLGCCIWFGIKGNEWAWQNKKWDSLEHFNTVQKNWTIAGIIVIVAGFILGIILGILLGVAAAVAGAK